MIGLERCLKALHEQHVAYVMIGGMAARAHGSARVTQDVDIVYARADANIARLVKALQPFEPYLRGAPPGLPFEWSARTIKAGLNFTLLTTIGAIDILGEVAGGGRYEDLVAHSVSVEAFGHSFMVVTLPWLIRLKRAAGRVKDLEAIAELELLRDLGGTGQVREVPQRKRARRR